MTISAEKKQKYIDLRTTRGLSQAEARAIVHIGRTAAWTLDKQNDLTSEPTKTSTPKRRSTPEDTGALEDAVREHERSGVIAPGTSDGFDRHEAALPEPPELTLPDVSEPGPRRGSLLFFQGDRGTQPIRDFGESVHPDDVFPMPTSGRPGSPVRVRVHVRDPIPRGDDPSTRIGSHR